MAFNYNNVVDWENRLSSKLLSKSQLDCFSTNLVTYRSGASSRADIAGYMRSGLPIGVTITDCSLPVRQLIKEYLNSGHSVFLDSGAFRCFQANLRQINQALPPTNSVNFERVISLYEDILTSVSNSRNLMIVAPDLVGDQTASFNLLKTYADSLSLFSKTNVKIMIPLQKGQLSINDYYRKCIGICGFEIVPGIPSNAAAITNEDVKAFIKEFKPPYLHFLGTSEHELVHVCNYLSPHTRITTDATKLRQHIGNNRLLTELHKQRRTAETNNALMGCSSYLYCPDETEIIGDPHPFYQDLPKRLRSAFAKLLDVQASAIDCCSDNDEFWSVLDERWGGAGGQIFHMYLPHVIDMHLSPKVRRDLISELASADII